MNKFYAICLASLLYCSCQKEETPTPSSAASSSSLPPSSAVEQASTGTLTLEQALQQGTLSSDTAPAPSAADTTPQAEPTTPPQPSAETTEPKPVETVAKPQANSTPIQIPPKVQSTPKAPQGSGNFVIQVKASTDKAEIQRDAGVLKKSGISSYILKVDLGGNTVYRLRIGGFISSAKAREYAESKLVPMGYQYWLDSKSNEK